MKKSPFAALTAILATLFAALTVLGTAAPALAHDALKSSDPAKGATVKAVGEVKLEFTGKVRMPFVSVYGAGDEIQHQEGDPGLDGRVVTQRLKAELPDGAYVIAYRVVSSDGHPIEGEIPFTVKGATPAPSATPTETATATAGATATATAGATSAPASPAREPASAEDDDTGTAFPIWLLVVVGALAGVGIGFLLSARKKKP